MGVDSLKNMFFSWVQLRELEFVRSGDLVKRFNMSPKQERELLSRLARGGQIVRLSRGLYLVPKKLPPGGKWRPHEYLVLSKLMECLNADYQIGGPTAFNRWGFSEQIPNNIFVYNTKISGTRKIAGLSFQFAKVPKSRIGGTTDLTLRTGEKVKIATATRSILDAIYDWERFNSLPKAYSWLAGVCRDSVAMNELLTNTLLYGNIGTTRRIGFILQKMNVPFSSIKKLKEALPKDTQVAIPAVPRRSAKGSINRDWGVIDNLPELENKNASDLA